MANIGQKVQLCRQVGGIIGATAVFALLRRRTPRPGLLATGAMTVAGGFGGSLMLMPLGVMLGAGELRRVEDPEHLKRLLQETADQRRGRAPMPVDASRQPPEGGRAGSGTESWGDSSMSGCECRRRAGQAQGGHSHRVANIASTRFFGFVFTAAYNEPGRGRFETMQNDMAQGGAQDVDMGPGSSSSSSVPTASPHYQSTAPQYQRQQQDQTWGQQQSQQQPPQGQQQQQQPSRWAQLRGANTAQGSTWERIRQDNARQVYNARRGAQEQGPQQGGGSSSGDYGGGSSASSSSSQNGSTGLADPTFGKGTSTSRQQAQREFEASFDRERRGIDG